MSLFDQIENVSVKQAAVKGDSMLVDYLGAPSPFKQGEFVPNMRTIAYRKPAPPYIKKNVTDPDPTPGPVFEIDLLPGVNEIPLDVWDIVKPSLDFLLKAGKRKVGIAVEDLGRIKTGEENFVTEKWIKQKPTLIECGMFSDLDEEKAVKLIDRCVNEKLLEKFAKTFPESEDVKDAIESQLTQLENAVIKR